MSIDFNQSPNQIVGGAIILASSLIKLLSYAPVEFLTKFESLSWMFDMAFFITCIWGSVKVFGKFPSEDKRDLQWGNSLMLRYELKLLQEC